MSRHNKDKYRKKIYFILYFSCGITIYFATFIMKDPVYWKVYGIKEQGKGFRITKEEYEKKGNMRKCRKGWSVGMGWQA